jgi:hypothetical protein
MKQDTFFHIQRFLHFSGNKNEPDKTDKNYDKLWKMRTIFDKLIVTYAKYYSSTEHLAADKKSLCFSKVGSFQAQTVWNKNLQAM